MSDCSQAVGQKLSPIPTRRHLYLTFRNHYRCHGWQYNAYATCNCSLGATKPKLSKFKDGVQLPTMNCRTSAPKLTSNCVVPPVSFSQKRKYYIVFIVFVFGLVHFVLADAISAALTSWPSGVKKEGKTPLARMSSTSPSFPAPPTLISTHCSRNVSS
jgi:hypothetical protein